LQVYAAIKREVATGGRAYIVCPLVAESGSGSEQLDGVRTVQDEFARLKDSGETFALPEGVLYWQPALPLLLLPLSFARFYCLPCMQIRTTWY
jgi:hypothetical protein